MRFEPTRDAGLNRLAAFAPQAGAAYREGRNSDLPAGKAPAVSQLSPWLRHRLVAEWEVLAAVLDRHSPQQAMPYIQEVFWRGYFKGWLEQHPGVWESYRSDLAMARSDLPEGYAAAVAGATGIACFDHWCEQLRSTGYLHNHARMWFASVWIFTLRLPWQLGAGFFLDTLIDADPASNTLSWRWVAGLHTRGKHYLATAENISRFTDGRFFPKGQLNESAAPLEDCRPCDPVPLRLPTAAVPERALRLVTEEDCLPDCLSGSMPGRDPAVVLGVISPFASAFAQGAVRHSLDLRGGVTVVGHNWSRAIIEAAAHFGTQEVVTPFVPVGYVRDGLQAARQTLSRHGIRLHEVARPYDAMVWPHAARGFFRLKQQIPQFLKALPA